MAKKDNDFSVGQFFEDCGYDVSYYPNKRFCRQFYAHGKIFNIRSVDNTLQFGVRTSFDRWANSVDFITGMPKNERQAIKKLSMVIDLYEANDFDQEEAQGKNVEEESYHANPQGKKMWQMRHNIVRARALPGVQR